MPAQKQRKQMTTPVKRDIDTRKEAVDAQSTLRITTPDGASEKCRYPRSVLIPEVSFYAYR